MATFDAELLSSNISILSCVLKGYLRHKFTLMVCLDTIALKCYLLLGLSPLFCLEVNIGGAMGVPLKSTFANNFFCGNAILS